jgi:lipopolysaccharide biosynthesis glycosyltransferase
MNIAYSSSEYYFEPTYVSIFSLLANSNEKHNIILLSSGIPGVKIRKLEAMVVTLGSIFECIDITQRLENLAKKFSLPLMRGGYSTYARLFLADILVNIKNIVLIDGDTLVIGDISTIKKYTKNYVMLACRDYVISNKYSAHEDTLLSNSAYYNMGILYINLDLWRKNNLTHEIEKRFDLNYKLNVADQTIINKYLKKFVQELDLQFNYYTYFHYKFDYKFYCHQNNNTTTFIEFDKFIHASINTVVLHFIGTWYERPWFKKNISPYSDIYLHYWKQCFPVSELFSKPKVTLSNAIYGFLALFLLKFFGLKMYFLFRYRMIQKIKKYLKK